MRTSRLIQGTSVGSLLAAVLLSSAHATDQPKEGWTVNLGTGVATAPRYEGSKERYTSAVPVVDIAYKRGSFLVSPGAVTWTPLETGAYAIGALLTYDFGRREKDGNSRFNAGSDTLRGLGDIKGTAEFGVHGRFGPVSGTLRKAPSGRGHGGTIGEISIEWPIAETGKLVVTLAPSVAFMDRRYAQAYFGVTEAQSRASGKRVFKPNGGTKSYALALAGRYALTERWSLAAVVSVGRLGGDLGQSPVVEKRDQTSAALTLNYAFQ